ncbi:MAG: NAD(P)-dependent oxidoreductase, partial [SAR324 cluster bacterium]|nr:NAD(P)-dependent oxidoreductase [SAR324 cluster bacterium]
YTEAMYRWFGQQPRLSFQPFDEWLGGMSEQDAAASRGHVIRSSCHSIEKSRQRLGYHPRYSSLEAIQQAVQVLITQGKVTVPASK